MVMFCGGNSNVEKQLHSLAILPSRIAAAQCALEGKGRGRRSSLIPSFVSLLSFLLFHPIESNEPKNVNEDAIKNRTKLPSSCFLTIQNEIEQKELFYNLHFKSIAQKHISEKQFCVIKG